MRAVAVDELVTTDALVIAAGKGGKPGESLRASLRGERRVQTVSRVQDGTLGIRDVALSLPTVVDAGGAVAVVSPELSPDEHSALEHSAAVLRQALRSLDTVAATTSQ